MKRLFLGLSICLLALFMVIGFIGPGLAADLKISQSVTDWVLDEARGYLYTVSTETDNLTFIRTSDLRVMRTIYLGYDPSDIEMADGKLYIPLSANRQIAVVDLANQNVERFLTLNNEIYQVAVDGDKLFFTKKDNWCSIGVYSLSTNSVTWVNSIPNSLYEPAICVDRARGRLYVGESELSGSMIYCIQTSDYKLISKSNYDHEYGFFYPTRKIVVDSNNVYYAERSLNSDDLTDINGQYLGEIRGSIQAVCGEYVVSNIGVFNREQFVMVATLPSTAHLVLMDGNKNLYIYDWYNNAITKKPLTLDIDNSLHYTNGINSLMTGIYIADWVIDQTNGLIYAISPPTNRLLYIRASDLAVVGEKYIGSYPTDVEYFDGKLYIALSGSTKVAVTGTDPSSPVSLINLSFNPYKITVDQNHIYYTEEDQRCYIAAYNFSTGKSTMILPSLYIYQPSLTLDREKGLLYIAESGISNGTIYICSTSDFQLVADSKTDYNSFEYPERLLFIDDDSIYYNAILNNAFKTGCRLNRNDPTVIDGCYYDGLIRAIKDQWVFTHTAIYDRDRYVRIGMLPKVADSILVDDQNMMFLLNNQEHTITRVPITVITDLSLQNQSGPNRVTLGADITDWVFDEDSHLIYAIAPLANRMLYIRADDLTVVGEKFIGSLPTDIELYNGQLFIALWGSTKVAVTGTSLGSAVTYINLSFSPYSIAVDQDKLFYVSEDQWVSIATYSFSTGSNQRILSGVYTYEPTMILDRENHVLYLAESGLTASNMYSFSTDDLRQLSRTTYQSNGYPVGFYLPVRMAVLDGDDIFYAGYRFDSTDLSIIRGSYGEEPIIGAFGSNVLGCNSVFDRDSYQRLNILPYTVSLAYLTNDGEIYLYDVYNRTIFKHASMEEIISMVSAPIFSPDGGTYMTAQKVTISCATPNATIHYTTDGSEPTESDPVITSGATVTVGTSLTLKVKAWKNGVPSETKSANYNIIKVATPACTPYGGIYQSPQSVTITCDTPGATIRYTTDGTIPTISSPIYSTPINISNSIRLSAKAWKTGMTESEVQVNEFTMAIATPQFSVAGGTYAANQSVFITCDTPGVTIRYTTNGTTPTTSSQVYNGTLIPVTGNMTLKAMAWRTGWVTSSVASATYAINVVNNPTLSVPAGSYSTSKSVVVSCATLGATIHYTTNGVDPTENDPMIASGGTIPVNFSMTLKVKAFKADWGSSAVVSAAYTITKVQTPKFSAGSGTYMTNQSIAITCDTPGVTIRYTTNGTTPTSTSPVYNGTPILVTNNMTLKAIALRSGWATSAVASASYTINMAKNPVLSIPSGIYTTPQNVVVTCSTVGATIHYTTNGNDPTESDPTIVTGGAIPINAVTTLKVKAFKTGWGPSGVVSNVYTMTVAAPVCTPAAGTYTTPQNVKVTCSTPGAIIHYTTNGVDPTENDPTIASGGTIPVNANMTLKVKAFRAEWGPSAVVSAAYTLKAAAPVCSPAGGTYPTPRNVIVTCATAGTTIYYTTNGIEPTENDPIIASGGTIPVTVSTTLKFRVVKEGWTPTVTSAAYTITQVQTPKFSVLGGTYTANQSVAITCNTPGVTIRYTTNGTIPTTSSRLYNGTPIAVTSNMTIIAKAWRTGWTTSPMASAAYTINVVKNPVLSINAGTYTTAQNVTATCATAEATIHYTTNGIDPTEDDPTIASGGTIPVNANMTLKVKAFRAEWGPSAVVSAAYVLKVTTPVSSLPAGTYATSRNATVTCATAGAEIHYTTNGIEPTESDPMVASGGTIPINFSLTLKLKAFKAGCTPSTVVSYAYNITSVMTPNITPNGGTFTSSQNVMITCDTPGATIRYTTNGTTPTTTNGTVIASGSIVKIDRSLTLMARAWKTGLTASGVKSAEYSIFIIPIHNLLIVNDGNGITNPTDTVSVEENASTSINASANAGYRFVNWTQTGGTGTATFGDANAASTTVTVTGGDATIRANFAINEYTLSIGNDGYGSTTPSGSSVVNHGATTSINASANAGYRFVNWAQTGGTGTATFEDANAASTTTTVTGGDATIRANFAINQYTVTFDSQGGSGVTSETVVTVVTEPGVPTRTGYAFVGWYKEPECTTPWDFSKDIVTNNMVLYAKWLESTPGLIFTLINDNAEYSVQKGTANTNGHVIIPDYWAGKKVTALSDSAFSESPGLTSIKLPNGLNSIGIHAFTNCTSLNNITIPSGVISIGELAFSFCTSLTSLSIPNGVTSIKQSTFWGCSSLSYLSLPSSLTTIGKNAFGSCSSLTGLTLPIGVRTIGEEAFICCTNLTSLTIPEGVTSIEDLTFSQCSSLTNVMLPSSIRTIGNQAFGFCSSLASLTLPEGVTSIETSSFTNCIALTHLTIPTSVKSIGMYAFSDCTSLVSLILPSGITSIEKGTFAGCRSLTNLILPSNVTSIGDSAFSYCRGLTDLLVPNGVTSISDLTFFECTGLTSLILPSGIKSIGTSALSGCTALKTLTLPSAITFIGKGAFSHCTSLTTLIIPSGIISIGDSAFYNCIGLIEVSVYSATPPIAGANMFYNCNLLVKINVPADSVSAYQTADGWSTYASKIAPK